MVKPVKFTGDSDCLPRDEFLVISEGDHMLMYIFVFFFYCWALYFIFTSYVGLCLIVHRMTLVSFRMFRKHLGN